METGGGLIVYAGKSQGLNSSPSASEASALCSKHMAPPGMGSRGGTLGVLLGADEEHFALKS